VILGIIIGAAFMICLILAFMAGYGVADLKNKPTDEEGTS
jgi:hypothetical protein